jgi:CheY-like chemotaxis protein/anti-sigma regulatory factor (Ser/Thr protein kinase)
MELELTDFDLPAAIDNALTLVRERAGRRGVTLQTAIGEDVGMMRADERKIRQALLNLLSNAIKFTPQGGVVSTEVSLGGDRVRLAVRDNGQGIAQEFLPHVFERFTQADTSTTRRAGGLGIGLALVRNLVELHGGKVRAESEGVGRGATFTVELPAPAIATAVRSAAPAAGVRTAERRLSGLKVHVVDDDADAREVIGLALRQAGAAVEAFESGDALLVALERGDSPPDVLLLDLAMPGEDGFAVLVRVRALEAARAVEPECELPAIAVSAFTQIDRQRLAAAGFRDRVAKPVDAERLVSAIRAVVDWPWPGDARVRDTAVPDQPGLDAGGIAR